MMHPLQEQIGRRIVLEHRTIEIVGLKAYGRKQYLVGRDESGVHTLIPPRVVLRRTRKPA
jgi:hypothetical protein